MRKWIVILCLVACWSVYSKTKGKISNKTVLKQDHKLVVNLQKEIFLNTGITTKRVFVGGSSAKVIFFVKITVPAFNDLLHHFFLKASRGVR